MPKMVTSPLAHRLLRERPDVAAFIDKHIIGMLRTFAETPIPLDEVVYYGSAAHDTVEPWHEDVDLCDELLVWLLGAILLCERGELRARYRVSSEGTRDETAAIMLSRADATPEAE